MPYNCSVVRKCLNEPKFYLVHDYTKYYIYICKTYFHFFYNNIYILSFHIATCLNHTCTTLSSFLDTRIIIYLRYFYEYTKFGHYLLLFSCCFAIVAAPFELIIGETINVFASDLLSEIKLRTRLMRL